MKNNEALAAMGHYLYQDIDLDARDADELAKVVLAMMTPAERRNLQAYLALALQKYSPSELKGQLNRVSENWRFKTKHAAQFLRALAEHLAAER